MLTTKEKLFANLIGNFHTYSRNMARMIVKPKPIVKSKQELKDFIKGLGFGITPSLHDQEYYFDTWDKWLKAIEIDWTNMNKYITDAYDCKIPSELAFAWGLFFSDGSCGLRKGKACGAWWNIVNSNLSYLKRAKKALDKEHKELVFKIKEYPYYQKGRVTNYGPRKKTLYRLEATLNKKNQKIDKWGKPFNSNGGARKKLIELYRHLFYKRSKKKTPSTLYDKYYWQRVKYLEGVIAGDGCEKGKYISVGYSNQNGAYELAELMNSLGWKYRIDEFKNKEWRIYYTKVKGKWKPWFCDNFADSFNARMSEYYGWNTSGRLSVALYRPNTNKIIGYHRASIIVVKEGPVLRAYAYDPMIGMEDKYDKIEKAFIQIKNWIYKPNFISFN